MGTHRARARALERVERLAGSAADADSLWLEAIAELGRAVTFDRWCALRIDPDSLTGFAGIGDYPIEHHREVPKLIVLDAGLGDVSTTPAMVSAETRAVTLRESTGGRLERAVRWREIYEPLGISDELRVLVADGSGVWGSVMFFNSVGDPAYTEDERALLAAVSGLLAAPLRRAAVRPVDAKRTERSPGVLLVTDDLQLRDQTSSVRAWCEELGAGEAVPAPVWGVVGSLLAARPAKARVRLADGSYAVVEADRLGAGGIAVTIRQAGVDEVLDLLARAYVLSVRESELVRLVVDGLDTKELAKRLSISTYTVQDHLKSVFAKTGVRSRRELVSGLFQHANAA
jgi:DNA-binding CsgD family transcriptional regulator